MAPTTAVTINHPHYYQCCADLTRPIVALLIGEQHLDRECIEVAEELGLNPNAFSTIKYLWRAGEKDDLLTDLQKAQFFLERCRNGRMLTGLGQVGKAAKMLDELIEAQTTVE